MSISNVHIPLPPDQEKLAGGQRDMILALYREDHNRKQGKPCRCGICELAEHLGVLPDSEETQNAFGKPVEEVFRTLDAADKNERL